MIYRPFMKTIGSDGRRAALQSLGLVPLVIIAPGLLFAALYGAALGRTAASACFLFLFALVPGLLFYSKIMTMTSAFTSLAFAVYLLAGTAVERVARLMMRQRRSTMPQWSVSTSR